MNRNLLRWLIATTIITVVALLADKANAWCTLPPPANPASGPPVQFPNTPAACWPSAGGISGSGRGYLQRDFAPLPGATTLGGSAWGWWCQKPDLTWQSQTFACLDKYCPGTALAAVGAALSASSPGAALQKIIGAYSVKVTDWVETHDYNCLHFNMVAALQATKPIDSAPPPAVYWVTSTATYPLNSDGTRSITPWPVKAVMHEACDCSVKLVQYGATFCKVPTLSAAQVVVAGCGIKK